LDFKVRNGSLAALFSLNTNPSLSLSLTWDIVPPFIKPEKFSPATATFGIEIMDVDAIINKHAANTNVFLMFILVNSRTYLTFNLAGYAPALNLKNIRNIIKYSKWNNHYKMSITKTE
jgi:hypothetical protein